MTTFIRYLPIWASLIIMGVSAPAISSEMTKTACQGLSKHTSVLSALAFEVADRKINNQLRREQIDLLQGYTRTKLSLQKAQKDPSWGEAKKIIDLMASASYMGATIQYEASGEKVSGDLSLPIKNFLAAVHAPMQDAFFPEEREAAAILDLAGKKLVAAQRVLGKNYENHAVSTYLRATAYGDDLAAKAGLSVMCSTLSPALIEQVLTVGKRVAP